MKKTTNDDVLQSFFIVQTANQRRYKTASPSSSSIVAIKSNAGLC